MTERRSLISKKDQTPVMPPLERAQQAARNSAAVRGQATPTADGYDEFRTRVVVDRQALDVCIEEQAQVFLEVMEQHVRAKDRAAGLKDELTRLDAQLAMTVRRECEEAGVKATKDLVDDKVILKTEHIDKLSALNAATLRADEWNALRDAFQHRKSMLAELVSLFLAGYYSGTETTKNKMRDSNAADIKLRMAAERKRRMESV